MNPRQPTPESIRPNDWVAFLKDGQLVIASVLYFMEYPNARRYITTAGIVDYNDLIEVRQKEKR